MGVQQQPPLAPKPKAPKPVSEARRIRKPLMERKRRERINTSLNDLATLLAEAHMVKTEAGKPSKLEKADILELTVKHIRTLKGRSVEEAGGEEGDSTPDSSYKEGFSRCMGVVEHALGKSGKEALRERLLTHLRACLKTLQTPRGRAAPAEEEEVEEEEAAKERLSATTPVTPEAKEGEGTRLTLVPTRLPTGGVAFLVQGGIDPSLLLPQDEKGEVKTTSQEDDDDATPPTPPPEGAADAPAATTPAPPTECPPTSTTPAPTQCPPTPTKCPPTSTPTATQCPPTSSPTPIQCPPTSTPTQCPPTSSPAPTQCPPTSSPAPTQCPPTSAHPLLHPTSPSDPRQPAPTVGSYHTHPAHIPPTPPPSVSPQTFVHHPWQLQAVYEEEMDTDEDEYGVQIEVDDEEPYDLSMRRMWRPW